MAERVARKVGIYGRVQGVFFRQWAVHRARDLGVSGWIRNKPDGSVQAYVTGDEAQVSRMIEQLRLGPSGARVDDCSVADAEPEDLDGFSVRV